MSSTAPLFLVASCRTPIALHAYSSCISTALLHGQRHKPRPDGLQLAFMRVPDCTRGQGAQVSHGSASRRAPAQCNASKDVDYHAGTRLLQLYENVDKGEDPFVRTTLVGQQPGLLTQKVIRPSRSRAHGSRTAVLVEVLLPPCPVMVMHEQWSHTLCFAPTEYDEVRPS